MQTANKPALGAIRKHAAQRGYAGGGLLDKLKSAIGITPELAEYKARAAANRAAAKNQPAPEPAPASAPTDIFSRTVKRREQEAGLKNGGEIKGPAGAIRKLAQKKSPEGGKLKGPGTPTSDSIPAKVVDTGEPIQVATGERIISKKQDAFLLTQAKADGFDSIDDWLEDGTGHPVGPTLSYKSTKKMADGGVLDASQSPQDTYTPQAPAPAAAPAFSDTQIQAHKDAAKGIPDTFQKMAVPSLGVISGFKAGGAIRKMSTGGLIDEDAVDRVNRLGATRASGGAVPTLKQIAAAAAPSNAAQITAPAAPAPTPAPTPAAPAQAAGGQMSYGDQMRNVGNFLVDAPVKAVKTVVSAPGYGFNSPDAPKPAPAETPPAAWGGESNRGAIRSEPALAIAQATEQIASGEMPKPSNQVTRVGNSYSGGPGITGDISLVDANGAPVRSGGAISNLNNQAAENLARRYGQTSGFGTATSGGGTVSTVPGMSQDKINATLTNPDGSRWSAQDNAIMQANIRDGVDPYRGTSRAKKQITMRENLASIGDATTRRGQDINAAASGAVRKLAESKFNQESQLHNVDLQTKTNILNAQNALAAAKTPEQKAIAEENMRALQGKYEKAIPNKFTVVPEFDANGQRTGTTVLDSEGKPVEIKKPTGQGQFEAGKVYTDAKGNRAMFDGKAFVPA